MESLTADGDSRQVTDLTVNRHAPVRHVISVNGEDEDVEDINIHDFTTFEQEDLIGSEFIGRLKRKSVTVDGDLDEQTKKVPHNLSSFRSAVRAVLTTEVILQAMKHYNHRSDSDTEEDEDDSRTPVPTATELSWSGVGDNLPTDSSIHRNADLPVSVTSAQSMQSAEEPNSCRDKPCELNTAVNLASSATSGEKPDEFTSSTSDRSFTKDCEVGVVDTEAASSTRMATDSMSGGDATLSAPAAVVVDDALQSEVHVGASVGSEATDVSKTVTVDAGDAKASLKDVGLSSPAEVTVTGSPSEAVVSQTVAADTRDSKALLLDVDLLHPKEVSVAAAISDSEDADTAKPTDGLLTPTAERRPTETADTGCRCCSVQ